jgi:SAM-dependent methyltransferase
MPATDGDPELYRFSSVDTGPDPGALIAFLEAHQTLAGLRSAKSAMLDQLRLGQARSALDVGCGLGDDLIEMARRLPPGGNATGVDASQAMIGQARHRACGLGVDVCFETVDACRPERLLVHVPDPQRVIAEMTRVTRPGGRIAALDPDVGDVVVDHPDRELTRVITHSFAGGAVAHSWIGRQLPRLFRRVGLTEVSASPVMVLTHLEFFQMMFASHVRRLCSDGVLTSRQADHWWSELGRQAGSGDFLAGVLFFLVAATRP